MPFILLYIGVRMPFPTSPPQKPPQQQYTPDHLEEKLAKFNLSGQNANIPTEPVYQVESPEQSYQQKTKFEEIFKNFDQLQNGQSQKLRNGGPPPQQVNQPTQDCDEVWQLQKKFDQKPPSPPPAPARPQIPQVPGPCDPEDLVDGVLFAANYLGSTQLLVDKNSTKTARMMQAQEAMTRVKGLQFRALI